MCCPKGVRGNQAVQGELRVEQIHLSLSGHVQGVLEFFNCYKEEKKTDQTLRQSLYESTRVKFCCFQKQLIPKKNHIASLLFTPIIFHTSVEFF